jgi:hypothetical protein
LGAAADRGRKRWCYTCSLLLVSLRTRLLVLIKADPIREVVLHEVWTNCVDLEK